jgi:hypothetical protein
MMATKTKTCFVISPIGNEESEIRKNADDLYDLIIEPALEMFGFSVVRGDKVANAGSITDDIIKRIQNSELCIIDITGHNPNVFYECGRRHETAKPFIIMRRKGEVSPFDLVDIRAVDYDLSDPRKTRNSIDTLKKFVNEYEEIGYGSESATASLTSIADVLKRLERKIDSMSGVNTMITEKTTDNTPLKKDGLIGSPYRQFLDALAVQDYTTAVKALKRFMQISSDINVELDMASMLVEAFEPAGVPIVRSILEKDFDNLNVDKISIALHALYAFYAGALTIESEADYLRDLTKKALKRTNIPDKEHAALYNVLANIEYSLKNDLESLKYQSKTVEFSPSEPAYQYNISMLYNSLGMKDKLFESLSFLISIYKTRDPKPRDLPYLEYAKKIFIKNSQIEKVEEVNEIMARIEK